MTTEIAGASPVERRVRPAGAVAFGSDKHLTLIGAPWHLNMLTGQDRADMLAFGRACMEAERERWSALDEKRNRNLVRLLDVVGQSLNAGHINTEDLARLRAAYERA